MTASPAVASPGAGSQPQAGIDEVPPDGTIPEAGTDEAPPSRRKKVVLLLLLLLGFALLLGLAIWYLLFRQPINVLPPIPGQVVMPTYATTVYGADRPLGVAVSPDGSRIYMGESGGDRIARVFDASGNELATLRPPLSTGSSHVPVYLAIDPLTSEVYVTDRPTGTIFIYDVNGVYQRAYTPPTELEGWQPLGISFDAEGNLYVTDVSVTPQVAVKIDREGNVVGTYGTNAGMSFPNGVAADANGNVYITDSNNGRLLVFDSAGTQVGQVGRGVSEGNLGLPRGVAVGDDGKVYIADSTGQGVFVYKAWEAGQTAMEFLGFFGGEGVQNGYFRFPNGIALDARGRVYVADSGNDRVQVWSY